MSHINVVLHQPMYSSNVGAVARSMGNMGAHRLILVDPQCGINSDAKRAAVGCQNFLTDRTVYMDWDEFYEKEGEGLRIAFTARSGKFRPAVEAEELFKEIQKEREESNRGLANAKNIYLYFGREDSGLSSEDVELCHHSCTLMTYGKYSSLNLSQAVLIALYTAQKQLKPDVQFEKPMIGPESQVSPTFFPKESLQEWLETVGFDISNKKVNANKVLQNLLLRNQPSSKELRILEVVLKQTIRKLKEK